MILLMPLLVATLMAGTPGPEHAAPGASAPFVPVPALVELRCAS